MAAGRDSTVSAGRNMMRFSDKCAVLQQADTGRAKDPRPQVLLQAEKSRRSCGGRDVCRAKDVVRRGSTQCGRQGCQRASARVPRNKEGETGRKCRGAERANNRRREYCCLELDGGGRARGRCRGEEDVAAAMHKRARRCAQMRCT